MAPNAMYPSRVMDYITSSTVISPSASFALRHRRYATSCGTTPGCGWQAQHATATGGCSERLLITHVLPSQAGHRPVSDAGSGVVAGAGVRALTGGLAGAVTMAPPGPNMASTSCQAQGPSPISSPAPATSNSHHLMMVAKVASRRQCTQSPQVLIAAHPPEAIQRPNPWPPFWPFPRPLFHGQ